MSLHKTKVGLAVIALLLVVLGVVFVKYKQNERVLGELDIAESDVVGLVIPHHELADELIISAIEGSRKNLGYDKVVIIGPNHYFPNSHFITTTEKLGDYSVDYEYVDELNSTYDFVELNRQTLENEHSVGIPITYLKEAYPEAEFVPLIVSHHYNEEIMEELANSLSSEFSGNSLFVLAVDFAHNVGFVEAMENNDESVKSISNFDYESILAYDDRHMDSPLSTVLFLKVMERLGANNWKIMDSSHGSVILGIPDLQGTSYLTGVFTK
ncbi:MAG: AmmeMemoRadiSam system protein B [Candidatus Woesebacteria bacterium]|jgi:AmmeMemoRadiSam system protein B